MNTNLPVRNAFILLIFSAAWIIMEHVLGFNSTRHDVGEFTRLVPALVYWASLFLLMARLKKRNGSLKFLEGWKAGIISSFVYAAGFTLVVVIYSIFINPGFYESYKAYSLSQLEAHQATQAQIDDALREIDMTYGGSPFSYLLLFLFSFLWGIVLSAIASLVFMSKAKTAAGTP